MKKTQPTKMDLELLPDKEVDDDNRVYTPKEASDEIRTLRGNVHTLNKFIQGPFQHMQFQVADMAVHNAGVDLKVSMVLENHEKIDRSVEAIASGLGELTAAFNKLATTLATAFRTVGYALTFIVGAVAVCGGVLGFFK